MRQRHYSLALALLCLGLPACGEAQENTSASAAAPAPSAEAPTAAAPDEVSQGWRLDAADSRISFVSIKAGDAAENHYFREIDGRVGTDGAAEIRINLDSVETRVDIRNERMREILFETGAHPTAEILARIDLAELQGLADGERLSRTIELTLSVHGVEATTPANVFVSRLGEDRVSVETVEPVLILADDFGLAEGRDKLRELAGLPAISAAVPVTASLVFER